MTTLAIPFLLVLALYFLPLNLKVIVFALSGFLACFKVAFKRRLFADFLTFTFLRFKICFTVSFLFTLTPSEAIVIVYFLGVILFGILNTATPFFV